MQMGKIKRQIKNIEKLCQWDTDALIKANRKYTYDGPEKRRHNLLQL